MRQSVLPFPTPVLVHKTASGPRDRLDLRAVQVRKDLEETEEHLETLVQWVRVVSQDSQVRWDHQVHKALQDFLGLESLVAQDLREIVEIKASLVFKVLLGHVVLWVLLDQAELGGHQEKRGHLDPEAQQGPWEILEIQVYQESLESQANQETQEAQDLLVLKGKREKRETLHPRT